MARSGERRAKGDGLAFPRCWPFLASYRQFTQPRRSPVGIGFSKSRPAARPCFPPLAHQGLDLGLEALAPQRLVLVQGQVSAWMREYF